MWGRFRMKHPTTSVVNYGYQILIINFYYFYPIIIACVETREQGNICVFEESYVGVIKCTILQ